MIRFILSIVPMLFALTGCDPASMSSSTAPSGPSRDSLRSVQDSGRPDISPEQVIRDVIDRVVEISEAKREGPTTEWTFAADEFRQVEILDRRTTQTGSMIVIFMTTRDNPQHGEEGVQVSGKLQLYYEWREGRWALTRIENLTFQYTIGLAA